MDVCNLFEYVFKECEHQQVDFVTSAAHDFMFFLLLSLYLGNTTDSS